VSTTEFDAALAGLADARAAQSAALLAVARTARPGAQDAAAARAQAQRATEMVAGALQRFAQFSDPRANLERLSDRSPLALFPVRLETRFRSTRDGDVATFQLLVRIYPDDCSIDTFEPVLSDGELANVQRYWRATWRAGGVEADQRAAWRALATAHGSGRAGWLVDNYQPVNPADQPVKAAARDEILVISTTTPLSAAEAAAVSAYWRAVWIAGSDATATQAARAALEAAVGAARAATLVAEYRPYNLEDAPVPPDTRTSVQVSTAFVVFPADPPTKQASWSQAPRVAHFPERFVVLGYQGGAQTLEAIGGLVATPLYVGPDPSADPLQGIHPTGPNGEDLFVPDELLWMFDFDRAVAAGLGLRIDLTPEQARTGFDRLLVLGVQMSASDLDGRSALEELLQHHAIGRAGLSLVAQGTPTHNTSGKGTGYTRYDDPDASFDDRRNAPLFTVSADPLLKRDGQHLAEALGIDPAILTAVHGSGGSDQLQARAMQAALWPATLGYWMDKMLAPAFDDRTVEQTRGFFLDFVSGRGAVPAIRIGGQPYGILPTTRFSRMAWLQPRQNGYETAVSQLAFLPRLYALLRAVDADWTAMTAGAAHVGSNGDAQQILLDVVGLHPASIEFWSRYSETLDQLFNTVNLYGLGPDFWTALLALGLEAAAAALLARFGDTGQPQPDILRQLFLTDATLLGTVVDDRPLSEIARIRDYTDDHRNYIQWLHDAATTSLSTVISESGFSNDVTPRALLYLYLRHAVMLGYHDSSYSLYRTSGVLSAIELAATKPEPPFVHVAEAAASESRFARLYTAEPRITGDPARLVVDHITLNLATLQEASDLAEQVAALQVLAQATTAQLERLFAEHIDICSYRVDAWLLALVRFQLATMRAAHPAGPPGNGRGKQPGSGVYLGAYAWLEDLRPSTAQLSTPALDDAQEKVFGAPSTLLSDPGNGGYIHAPSLAHARTAAVLRSGYLANADPAHPGVMAVNLSSGRVRVALSMLEGIRNGQSLGALLGYHFERGLHDRHGLVEVDRFIYPLRKEFPLVSGALQPTTTGPHVPIEAVEARNVIDGRKLVDRMQSGAAGSAGYPFGASGLPAATAAERQAIDAEAAALVDIHHAIADLALAEGVHQAVQGNFDRIAATHEAYTSGNFPPDPEVVQTPAAGIGLTHRVAVHLRPGLAAPAQATPRAEAEPAIDDWLAGILPPLAQVGCVVEWTDPDSTVHRRAVRLSDLKIRPIDLLSLVKPDDAQAMTELDDRVLAYVDGLDHPRLDATIRVRYMEPPAVGAWSIFQVGPLLRSLRTLVIRSRPLRATDAMLHGAATPELDAAVSVDPARITTPQAELQTLGNDITAFLAVLAPLVANPTAQRNAIVAGVDGFIDTAAGLLQRAAAFALPQSGWGFAMSFRRVAATDILTMVRDLVARWHLRLVDYDARIAAYDLLPAATPDADRFARLQQAEAVVSTTHDPLPAAPATMRTALDAKRAAFAAARGQFQAVLAAPGNTFSGVLNAVAALLPITAFDNEPFDLEPLRDRAVAFVERLDTAVGGQLRTLQARLAAVQQQLTAHAAAAAATDQVAALQAAARALLGDDFVIVPEFSVGPAQAAEWTSAYNQATGGGLMTYLTGTAGVDDPVEEWLHGVARVRPVMRAWEAMALFSDAMQPPAPVLLAAQFPYDAGASWVGMQFPDNPKVDSDRLLYTAQYLAPFNGAARQCGLLVDEWTEVIPAPTRDTGITFNFRRPDNEAPQCILLVTPASATGTWVWGDVVGALHDTLDLAKKRTLEPADFDSTGFAQLLPATIMATALRGISITTALAVANGVMAHLEGIANA
jgi:hypothetical protein